MPRPIHDLVEKIAEFPGIGPRQARRIVQFLLGKSSAYRLELAQLIQEAGKHITQCKVCFRFDDIGGAGACKICSDKNRDQSVLMVIEKDVDIEGVEESHAYNGRYFVLGGLLSMARPRKNDRVRSKELLSFISQMKPGLTEVILALSTTPEGDYTAREIAKEVSTANPDIKTTLLGRGLSVGAEIEYADQETIRSALKNRS